VVRSAIVAVCGRGRQPARPLVADPAEIGLTGWVNGAPGGAISAAFRENTGFQPIHTKSTMKVG
ncbi:MAG: hypothetical protein ACPF8Y_10430, partial [Flavobacteriales bacterium]